MEKDIFNNLFIFLLSKIVIDIIIVQVNLYEIDALFQQISQNIPADSWLDCPSFYINLQKLFSQYRNCSVSTKIVLSVQKLFWQYRNCSGSTEIVLSVHMLNNLRKSR
jgi:hypothetical protein